MRVFTVEEFGGVADGVTDCSPAIRRAVEAARNQEGDKVIRFGIGQYLLSEVIELNGIDHVRIEGCGERTLLLQSHVKSGGIWAIGCNDVTVSGFAFDMKTLAYCEGIIESIEKSSVILLTTDGFEDVLESDWFRDYGQNFASVVRGTGQNHYHMQDVVWHQGYERLDKKRWRIKLAEDGGMERCGLQPGDGFYLLSRGGPGKNDVYHASFCKNVVFENLTAYAGSNANLTLRNNENITVRNVAVREKNGRMISTDADAIHASGNRGKFEICHCYFEGMCDDGINVFSYNTDIVAVLSETELLMAAGFQGRVGDTIQIVDTKRCVKGEGLLTVVEPREDGVYIRMSAPVEGVKAGTTEMRVDSGIEMQVTGDQVFIKEECARLHIHHNYFGRYRGRGILAHVNAVIEDNVFDNNSAIAIHLTEDTDWPEGPVPCHIKVRRNRFICGTNVPQQPTIAVHWIADDGYLHDIAIEENHFSKSLTAPAVMLENASGIFFRGNCFDAATPAEYQLLCKGSCTVIE